MVLAHLPTLVVLLTSGSFSAWQLAQAARGRYRLMFVLDPEDAALQEQTRALKRLGDVVEVERGQERDVAGDLVASGDVGVVAYADEAIGRAADIASELDVPFHSPEVAQGLTDKHRQRELLRRAGLPTPDSRLVPAGTTPSFALEQVGLPAVVKPQRGASSRHAVRVDTVAELRDALARHAAEDTVVEGYLESRPHDDPDFADYVSVESVATHGHHQVLAVTGRFPLEEPFREGGLFMPAALEDDERAEVVRVAEAAVAALGVEHGFLHTEIKLGPDGPRVIEVNGRIGGGVPQMLERIGGPSVLAWSMHMAMGGDVPRHTDEHRGVSFLRWIQPPVGATRVVGVEGLAELHQLEGVQEVRLNKHVGDPVDWTEGSLENVLAIEGHVADHEALRTLKRTIDETVRLTYA